MRSAQREAIGITKPNVLQAEAIPAIAGRTNLILGAQTGSGKTLTYLIPVMSAIKADEAAGRMRAKPRRPRAIVLVPTRELALQVHETAKLISHHLKLSVLRRARRRARRASAQAPAKPDRRSGRDARAADQADGPGRTLPRRRAARGDGRGGHDVRGGLRSRARHRSQDHHARPLHRSARVGPARRVAPGAAPTCQHLAVGATHPEAALELYDKWMRGARRLMVQGTHGLPRNLRQNFLTCNGPNAKVSALKDLLGVNVDGAGKPSLGRVVLFCNSQQSARFVDHTLSEEGYACANYHGAVPANERLHNYESFVSGEAHILVTTDLAARGLDKLDVQHVVQFDFAKRPPTTSTAAAAPRAPASPAPSTASSPSRTSTSSRRSATRRRVARTSLRPARRSSARRGSSARRSSRRRAAVAAYGAGGGGGGGVAFPETRGIAARESVRTATEGRRPRGARGGRRGGGPRRRAWRREGRPSHEAQEARRGS